MTLKAQPFAVFEDKFLLRDTWQATLTLTFDPGDCVFARLGHTTIEKISRDDKSCTSRASMAMDKYSLAHPIESIHILTNH